MNEATILEERWIDIEDSVPKDGKGRPKQGKNPFAFLMWANNSVELVRILSKTRYGQIRVQRMVAAATQHEVELKDLRSIREVKTYLAEHHPDETREELKIPRLPRGILMKIWGR